MSWHKNSRNTEGAGNAIKHKVNNKHKLIMRKESVKLNRISGTNHSEISN